MKLNIHRENLLSPLQAIAGIVERKQTMPVLANVLLVVDSEGLSITGTNMEVELVCRVTDIEVISEGEVTIPARKFSDICRALPDGATINLALEGDQVHVKSGKSHFTLSTLPADHFPNIEEPQHDLAISFLQKDFKMMLEATAFAMAQQDVRYYLNGLLLELTDKTVRTVATDGHRLAMSTMMTDLDNEETKQVIIPRKGVLEFARLLTDLDEEVTLSLGQNHIQSEVGPYRFTTKLIDGKFPDYNRVIPRSGDKIVIANRNALKDILTRASILSHENIRGVQLQISDSELKVFANNPEHEQAEDSIEVLYEGESLQIGFNVSYLIDAINAIEDENIKLTFSNPNASALVESTENDQSIYVVMPMRL